MSPPESTAWLALLAGARPLSAPELAEAVAGLTDEQWDNLLRLMVAERLAPMVATYLQAQGVFGKVLASVRDRLSAVQRRNQANFAQQAYALARLARALNEAAIPFRLLKGLAVAAQAYPAPTARSVGDLDIWVASGDVPRAEAVLNQLGLRRVSSAYSPEFTAAFGGQLEFSPLGQLDLPASVDLHWHLSNAWWVRPSLTIPEGRIFARAQQVSIAGESYPTLTPTDTLFHLCLHATAGHHFQGLRCLVDILFMAKTGQVDWHALNALSQASGTQVILWRTFELVDELFGSNYRANVTQAPPGWQRRLVRRVLPPPAPGTPPPSAGPDALGLVVPHLVLLPHLHSMARAILRVVWPSWRWLKLRYGLHGRKALLSARARHLARLRFLLARRSS
ncbi:MAG TPA: nucleotidyltransferase family protein [Chloroflexia bacterium]|nr:nucleotidyltransferase family protein [Chloroflexia bacterium]